MNEEPWKQHRRRERIGGGVLAIWGSFLITLAWQRAIAGAGVSARDSILGAAITWIGVALLIFPGYRTERMKRGEDLSKLEGLALITPRWWAILAAAIAFGLLDWYLVAHR